MPNGHNRSHQDGRFQAEKLVLSESNGNSSSRRLITNIGYYGTWQTIAICKNYLLRLGPVTFSKSCDIGNLWLCLTNRLIKQLELGRHAFTEKKPNFYSSIGTI